tara:strand:+ start:2427 stop:2750 length:324 start_codon:yes stop_codon:yes gene_type:complete
MNDVLEKLSRVLEERKNSDPEKSYVAKLYKDGLDSILKKINEEAAETIMAAKDGDSKKIVYETADLWFRSMILLAQQGLKWEDVAEELARRYGVSGLEEKASRSEKK